MQTLGDLGLRGFVIGANGEITESNKRDCPVARKIPFNSFLLSKPYFTQSRTMPVNGHEVLEDIRERITKHGKEHEDWGDVTVYRDKLDIHGYVEKRSRNSSHPILTPDLPVTEIAFSRIITRINLIGNSNYSSSIAVKWEPEGCQVAIGFNVHTCDNYNIFGGTLLETGKNFSFLTMADKIEEHIREIEEKFAMDLRMINSLQNQPLNDKTVRYLLGDMDMRYETPEQVLNTTQITAMARNLRLKPAGSIHNLWDFTNAATETLRFDNNSGDTILETIRRTNDYVLSKVK